MKENKKDDWTWGKIIKFILKWIRNIVFNIFSLILFISGFFKIWSNEPTSAGVAFGGGAILLVFANLELFSKFVAFGVSAELREAKAITEEGKATIEQLRNLSLVTAKPILSIITRIGYKKTPYPIEEIKETKNNITKTLREIGIKEKEILKLEEEIHKTILVRILEKSTHFIYELLDKKEHSLNSKSAIFNLAQMRTFSEEKDRIHDSLFGLNIEQVINKTIEIINESKIFTPEEKELIKQKTDEVKLEYEEYKLKNNIHQLEGR